MDVYQKHIDVLLDKLEKHVDGNTFDIQHATHNCFADIIGGKSIHNLSDMKMLL